MLIALVSTSEGTEPRPTQSERQHVDIAIRELSQKLSNPAEINESDVFVAYTLAIWSRNIDNAATEIHINGVIALMRHVCERNSSSTMKPFWPLVRDDILWLTRKSHDSHRLCEDFRGILGPKTIQQRRTYEGELCSMAQSRLPDTKVLFGRSMHTSVHSMVELAGIVDQRSLSPNDRELDPIIESVLVELRVEQDIGEQKEHECWLERELTPLKSGGYVEDWRVEAEVIRRYYDLVILHVCRLAIIALESSSIQEGLHSSDALVAYNSFILILKDARRFMLAGIKDNRAIGTGISDQDALTLGIGNSYESYRIHKTNWPCKQFLTALLRADSRNPYLMEIIECVQGLAYDFDRFQEVFLKAASATDNSRTEELMSLELETTCY
jgi:hypothetical protein